MDLHRLRNEVVFALMVVAVLYIWGFAIIGAVGHFSGTCY